MAISCGGYRLIDLLLPIADRYGASVRAVVRPHLRGLVAADAPYLKDTASPLTGSLLLVNARMLPSVDVVNRLECLFRQGTSGVVRTNGAIAVARLPADVLDVAALTADRLSDAIDQLDLDPIDADLPLIEYPHDVVRRNEQILAANLEHRTSVGDYEQRTDGVFVSASHTDSSSPQIHNTAAFDTSRGPIVIEAGASIGPHTAICGPCYIGPNAKIAPGTSLKGWVTLGHTTKAGGEIEGTIFEPYTNKQHEGVMGYSYLGSWINIGAGTNQSDLKNTYGPIRIQYGSRKVDTGMQFLGCIMGDYTKTAINTGIFTGKTIGVASTLYGMVTTNVPSFVNYARSLGQMGEIPADVAVTTQRRMFARRSVSQRPADEQLLRDLFVETAPERAGLDLSDEPLAF